MILRPKHSSRPYATCAPLGPAVRARVDQLFGSAVRGEHVARHVTALVGYAGVPLIKAPRDMLYISCAKSNPLAPLNKLRVSRTCITYYTPTTPVTKFSSRKGVKKATLPALPSRLRVV